MDDALDQLLANGWKYFIMDSVCVLSPDSHLPAKKKKMHTFRNLILSSFRGYCDDCVPTDLFSELPNQHNSSTVPHNMN